MKATPDQAPVATGNIPITMRNVARWLLHDADKRPFYASGRPRAGKLNSPRDLAQLVTFDEAIAALAAFEGRFAGVGFALGEGWFGGDLDNVRDAKTGETQPWAAEIIAAALKEGLYVEVSPSQKGVHLIGYTDDPAVIERLPTLGANGTGVEFYKTQRYFTVTGITLVRVELDPGGGGKKQILANVDASAVIELSSVRHKGASAPPTLPQAGGSLEWPGFRQELLDGLNRVPAGRPRERWLEISFGIHHASGGSEEGFKIWHAWSAGANDGSYTGEADLRKQWASFKVKHARPVTWGTVKMHLDQWKAAAPEPAPDNGMTLFYGGELRRRAFEAPEYLLEGEFPLSPGAWILAGKPKQGKTWLAMNLMCAAIGSAPYCATRRTKPMSALYVGVDDTSEARFQRRMHEMDPSGKLVDFILVTRVSSKDVSSLELLSRVLDQHRDVRFVVIDTLAAFRQAQRTDSPYQQEHDELHAINAWATARRIVVLVVHHLRKGVVDPGDPYESISGTLGLQGGVDSLIVMHRKDLEHEHDESLNEKRAAIWVKGRDMENENAFGARLDRGRWEKIGAVADVLSAETRREILRVLLSDKAKAWTHKEIHAAGDFNCRADSVKRTASRMARAKLIQALPGVGFRWR